MEALEDKDFSIVNLEAPLTRSEDKIFKTGNNFKSPPESVQHILNAKFDAVALSNNHIRDFGDQGVIDTLATCKENGILTVGAGKNIEEAAQPLNVRIKGKNITFLNYSEREFNIGQLRPGANPFDIIDAFYQVKEAKSNNDYVFIIYHGGLEYHFLPTPEIIKKFKFLVDVGADCIVSHHIHRYSGIIEYSKKPIFYGLGNFLSPTKAVASDPWLIGILGKVNIYNNKISFDVIPIKMNKEYNFVDVLFGKEKGQVLNHIDELSKILINNSALLDYWNRIYLADTSKVINILKSDSFIEYHLRKRLSSLTRTDISFFKTMNILNFMRCDSHREKVIQILETKYNQKKT